MEDEAAAFAYYLNVQRHKGSVGEGRWARPHLHSREAAHSVQKLMSPETAEQIIRVTREVPGGLKSEQVKVFSSRKQDWRRGEEPAFLDKPLHAI